MSKQLMISLLAVTAGLILWTEANAQTCKRWKNVAGSNVCVAWRTGSEICEVIVSGINGSGLNTSSGCESSTCPVVTCSVFGNDENPPGGDDLLVTSFGGGGSGGGSDDPCDNTLDGLNCGLTGTLTCRRPEITVSTFGHSTTSSCKTKFGKLDPNCKIFPNVTLDPDIVDLPLTNERRGFQQCTSFVGGICRTSVTVDVEEGGNDSCKAQSEEFTVFQRFVANRFNAEVVFCPGGYAPTGDGPTQQCCATSARTYSNYCVTPNDGNADGYPDGDPTIITQRCTLIPFLGIYSCTAEEFGDDG